ncbi:MAG: hypothetical protein GF344_09780 [Chitinivibrionales bacterium]|nr:hypothetical protein [Chitinivibrionales bacterium]MBD3357129.1 hypothetical protein [Chitinivibrionales bacterium]
MKPKAIRYGWATCPDANLYSDIDETLYLPAGPFRTDSYPLSTHGVRFPLNTK